MLRTESTREDLETEGLSQINIFEALSSLNHWWGACSGGNSQCKKDPLLTP